MLRDTRPPRRWRSQTAFSLAVPAVFALLAAASLAGTPGQAKTPVPAQIVTLDVPGQDGSTVAYGINDKGEIVGAFGAMAPQGFLRDKKGAYVPLSVPGAFENESEAAGISSAGLIVGDYYDGVAVHGFVLDGGAYTTLDPPGATGARGLGINDRKQIVGDYDTGSYSDGVGVRGFVLFGGVYAPIDHPGADNTSAYGINNRGQVVGTYAGDDGVLHGFVYDRGVYTEILFPGGEDSRALAINDQGEIVGDYYDGATVRSFVRDSHGVYAALPDPPGSAFTTAYGINNAGQIVGAFSNSAGQAHGFLLRR